MDPEDRGVTSQVGPVEVNWPKAGGYYGGIALAVAYGLIEPPLALFIAAVPLFKMLGYPGSPYPVRIVSQVLEGASKPVGGDAEADVRIANRVSTDGLFGSLQRETAGIWSDAKAIARNGSAARR